MLTKRGERERERREEREERGERGERRERDRGTDRELECGREKVKSLNVRYFM